MEERMEITIVQWGHVGIMDKKTETTGIFGYICIYIYLSLSLSLALSRGTNSKCV